MIIKIQYSFSNNETLYMHKVSTRKLSTSQLENLRFGIIRTDQQNLSSEYENAQRKTSNDENTGNIDENLGHVSLRQCVRMLVASSPELFKMDSFVIPNGTKYEGNISEKASHNAQKKKEQNSEKQDLQSSYRHAKDNKKAFYQKHDNEQNLSVDVVQRFKPSQNMNRVIDYSVYNKDFLELGNPLTGHGSMKRLLSTKKLLKSKVHHNRNNNKSNSLEILKDVNHDNLIVGQFSKTSNFLFKDNSLENEGNLRDNEKNNRVVYDDNNQTRMLNKLTSIFQNDKYSLIVKLKFIEYTRDLNYKYDFNLIPSEVLSKLLLNNYNQIKRTSSSNTDKSKLDFSTNDKSRAPKASRTLSLPVFNQDTFDPNKQKINEKRKSKLRTNEPRLFNNNDAPIATRTLSMISVPLVHSNSTSSSLKYGLEENEGQISQKSLISSQVTSDGFQLQDLVRKNTIENRRNQTPSQSNDEMPPQSPRCVNCDATKSIRWAWFRGSDNPTLSEKEKSIEGLFCKECHDYYKLHDKLRPQKKKRKSSVSFSDPNITIPTAEKNGKRRSSFKKSKTTKPTSIAETLAFNRSNIDKKRGKISKNNKNNEDNRNDFSEINSDGISPAASYENNLLKLSNIDPVPTVNINSIVNESYFQNYEDSMNSGQLINFGINDSVQQNNKWIKDLLKTDSNVIPNMTPVEQSGSVHFNSFNSGNIEINENEIENALLLNSILSDFKNYDGNKIEGKNSNLENNKMKNDNKSNEDELLLICSSASSSLPSSPGFLEKSQEIKQ